MARLPGREPSPEEIALMQQQQEVKKHIANNEKIRCPTCKKNQYFDNYLANKQLGVLVCPQCGVLFMEKHKLKIVRETLKKQTVQPKTK